MRRDYAVTLAGQVSQAVASLIAVVVLARLLPPGDGFAIVARASGGTEVRMRFNLDPEEFPSDRRGNVRRGQERGSVAAASRPAASPFSKMM